MSTSKSNKPVAPVTKVESTDASKITGKKIGGNIIVTVDGKAHSRKVAMEEGEKIFKKIALFNKKPSDTLKASIIDLATPEAAKKKLAKEKLKVEIKGTEKLAKKTEKSKTVKEEKSFLDSLTEFLEADPSAAPKLQAVLDKYKPVEEKKEAVKPTPVPEIRRSGGGEFYGNR